MLDLEKSRRLRILAVVAGAVVGLLIVRLGWMQLWQGGQYKKMAEENRLRKFYSQAPRGTIYDRNGAPIVANRPSFAISILPAEYTNPREETPFLAELTGVPQAEIEALLAAGQELSYTPVRVQRDVDQATLTRLEERRVRLPGVIVEAVPVRQYTYGKLAAHLLGYVGRISEEEYAVRKQAGYNLSDLIGKDGLERVWEDSLRGVDGGREVEVNAQGEEVGLAGEKAAIAGKSLVLTIDANLQKAAEEALEAQIKASRGRGAPAKGGAVVVIDVRTGGVRAMASSPAFDPNVFARGITTRNWSALLADPNNPLTNRAIQNAYPPASVFKIVTASAALDSGLTNPDEIFDDKGVYELSGWKFYGWETSGLGKLSLSDALTWSSDPAFYELGRRLGADRLASYALTFGFGAPSGIRLPGEAAGMVPTEAWKETTYGEPWYPGETLIAAIGQGYYLATPMQQALLLMAVANGGIIYRPMLVDKVLNPDGTPQTQLQPEVARTIYLKPEHWEAIRRGLEAVPVKGTAASVFQGFGQTLAGKTGSAETGRGTVHSWFACYAPADKPEVAIAVLVEDGGEGSTTAAPVVRKVLEAYFGLPSGALKAPPPGKGD
ncbi:MAG TPA: penicillin-binding protein 2 [Selenomonadales bacterium]|nr:penicillin-binding protein 2 [Selenomonadales bacterium]